MVEFYRIEGSLAFISMIGSFIIIISYLMIKDLRKHPTNLVFYLSVCDFFFSLKFFLSSVVDHSSHLQENPTICLLQASFAQFFGLGSISWNGFISLNLIISLRNPFANTAGLAKIYHSFIWLTCILTTLVMVIGVGYGPSGDGTCWLPANHYQLLFAIPLFIYFVISLTCLTIASLRLRSLPKRGASEIIRRGVMVRMSLYCIFFIVLWSGAVIHRVWEWASGNDDYDTPGTEHVTLLQYINGICVAVQGFFNAAVWFTNPTFYKKLKGKVIGRIKKRRGDSIMSDTEENIRLLPDVIEQKLEDDNLDIQKLDIVLRKNIITCIILGIRKSIEETVHRDSYLSDSDYKQLKVLKDLSWEGPSDVDAFVFTDFSPLVFSHMRASYGVTSEKYLSSLNPDVFLTQLNDQKFSEGRSGSFFCFSPDKQFIIKTIPSSEAMLLQSILPAYHNYILKNPDSLISRVYGLHSVEVHHGENVFVVVMENVFNTKNKIHERYDLKGSWVRREVGKAHMDDPSILGMDLDLKRKLRLFPHIKEKFLSQIKSDSEFFAKLNIMDYSLLIGFHFCTKDEQEAYYIDVNTNQTNKHFARNFQGGIQSSDCKEIYYLGVIDILQLYDAQKQRERFFKVHLLGKDKHGISVQEPLDYSKRFVNGIRKILE